MSPAKRKSDPETAAAEPVEFVVESIALDAGRGDRLYLFGEDHEVVLDLAYRPEDRLPAGVAVDGREWEEGFPILRLVGTLHGDRYRVKAWPREDLEGAASEAEFSLVLGGGDGR